MKETNSAGQVIQPTFLHPCPVRCESTAGCNKCRVSFGYKQLEYNQFGFLLTNKQQ
jgi:hypothetical protein